MSAEKNTILSFWKMATMIADKNGVFQNSALIEWSKEYELAFISLGFTVSRFDTNEGNWYITYSKSDAEKNRRIDFEFAGHQETQLTAFNMKMRRKLQRITGWGAAA